MSARTPKICIVTPEYPPEQWGGLARTVGRVASHASSLGLEVHVAHLVVVDSPVVLLDECRSSERRGDLWVHRIAVGRESTTDAARGLWDCPHTLTLRMMYQALEILIREIGCDLLHAFFLYPVGYVAGLLARRFGIPCVLTVVGNDVKKYGFSPEKVAVCRSGLENADLVVGLSQDLLDMADALTRVAEKGRVIYNSVESPDRVWCPRPGRSGPLRVGCAGIFKYAKGLPYLIKAMATIAKRRNAILELRGQLREGERPMYEAMIARPGVQGTLVLEAPIPHDQISDWLCSLDIFVLPSVSEGCPNILMEALACGVPCVATHTGANDALIEHRQSGLLVPWGDSTALEAAIEELVDNPGLAQKLGHAARERMKGFSREREREAWRRVYATIMGNGHGI
jgi:glycosyltransferase involved in cell wall biosynthesis